MYPSNQHHDFVPFPPNTVSLFLLQTRLSSGFQLFGHKAQTPCLDSDQQTVHESLPQEESGKQKVPIAAVSTSPRGPCYCVTHLTYSCDSGGPQQCSPSKRQHHLCMCQRPDSNLPFLFRELHCALAFHHMQQFLHAKICFVKNNALWK